MEALRLYSQCIAAAPNDSEELALGYGNRSALLFRLKKYRDCIVDCDRALKITTSQLLKCKLLSRKAESLALLNDASAKNVCEKLYKSIQTSFQVSLYFDYIYIIYNNLKN